MFVDDQPVAIDFAINVSHSNGKIDLLAFGMTRWMLWPKPIVLPVPLLLSNDKWRQRTKATAWA